MSKLVYAVAMSGGIDSSVSAYILKEKGYNVFGITMDLYDNICENAIEDSYKICENLEIKHFVFDVKKDFKKYVIDKFVEYYSRGLTPNPCAFCNKHIKLDLLLNFAREKGADLLATGHYADLKIDENNNNVILKESKNLSKDQSYFLSITPKENLRYIRFPLYDIIDKEEIRKIADKLGFHNSQKKDSQDICFISNKNYKDFLKNIKTDLDLFKKGNIILSKTNNIIGEHKGIVNYTTGQRKGLNISYNSPLYITKIDAINNEITVSPSCLSNISEFFVNEMNWILDADNDEFYAYVKLRSICKKIKAKIQKVNEEKIKVILEETSQTPVTNGQICAIYNTQNIIIGAGIINN